MSIDQEFPAPETDGGGTRRAFLARAGATAGGLLAGSALAAPARAEAAPRTDRVAGLRAEGAHLATAQAGVTRYDIRSWSPTQLQKYQNAIQVMKGRPASDPTSYAFQANIHNIYCNNPPAPYGVVHYSWKFLPWHRAYLYYFEKIVQAAAGNDPSVTLPYWNWSVDLTIPSPFWGNGNPLYDPRRNKGPNDRVDPARTAIGDLVRLSTFQAFGGGPNGAGSLETGPHNYVHSWVGGDMGSFATAAIDPLFWSHHANVDRVWYLWMQGAGHVNPTDPNWLGITYPFWDASGRQFTTSFQQVMQLQIRYAPPAAGVLLSDPPGQGTLGAEPVHTGDVALPAGLVDAIRMPDEPAGPRPVLVIRGVEVPTEAPVSVNVFVNRPDANASTATTETGFAGSFTLIPVGHASHEPVDVYVAVSTALPRALAATNNVRFSLVPDVRVEARGTLRYDRLELELG